VATQTITQAFVQQRPIGDYAYSGPEAASATFIVGAVLVYTSGLVAEGGTDPIAILGIAGSAGQNKSAGVATTLFTPILPGTIFEMNLCGSASTSYTLTQADLGATYGIVKRTAGAVHWVVDQSDTTNVRVRIVGFVPRIIGGAAVETQLVGDVNARVYCTLIPMQSTNIVSAWG